jgi:hypothetical protein
MEAAGTKAATANAVADVTKAEEGDTFIMSAPSLFGLLSRP